MHRTRSGRSAAALVLALLIGLLAACSGGGDGDEKADPAQQGGDVSTDAGNDEPADAGEAMVEAPGSGRLISTAKPARGIETPVQNVYYWKGDDNGDVPGDGSHMFLLFEPNGSADLMVENAEDRLTIGGQWEYEGGEMSLAFTDDNLTTDVSFELDLDADEVTMPFRLLSGGEEGESTWIRSTASPQAYLTSLFLVATGGVDDASGPEAVERAVDYANAVIEANGSSPSNLRARPAAARGAGSAAAPAPLATPIAFRGSAAPQQSAPTIGDPGPIQSVELVKDSNGNVIDREVRINWADGPPTTQLLWTWSTPGTSNLELTQGPLAGDPRTHLPTKPTGNTSGDPATKRAVFIEPLNSFKSFTWNKLWGPALQPSGGFEWGDMADTLEDRGYSVTEVEDEEAGVVGMTKALLEGGDPGLVILNTHGGSSGDIMTPDLLLGPEETAARNTGSNAVDYQKAWNTAMGEFQKKMTEAGYADLLSYTDAKGNPALTTMQVHVTGPNPYATYVALTPVYWDWLRDKKGLDLSKSLVYMGACLLDQSDLRDHVRAGSFWAFNKEIPPDTAGAIAQYVVESVAKPSWTAEEAFYNTVRVVNTKQMTYEHDEILDGMVPADHVASGTPTPLFDPNQTPLDKGFVLNAYGMKGTTAVPYAGHGWLDPKAVSGAQVWWMTWAARWGQDAIQGAGNLDQCWAGFWSKGNNGGLGSPFCNAANAGSTPKQPEVEYAKWLLTGQSPPADALTRWTLNES